MTLSTFFKKFDQFADAPNAVAKMLAPRRGAWRLGPLVPVVSLRSTTGYKLLSLRDEYGRGSFVYSADAGGIRACSRWSSPRPRATPPDTRFQIIRTPAGVPARPAQP